MKGQVLVLNQDFSALTVCSVERAIVLVLLRKAEVVAARPGRFVRSPSVQLPWPSVVRLKWYVRVPYKHIMLNRRNILRRDATGASIAVAGKT
nr:hypothetical protein [Rhodothermus marinus]